MGDLTSLIDRCVRETAQERGVEAPEDLGPVTPLFGRSGVFDSLGLVAAIVAVEEAIEEEFGVSVTLADERAMSQKRSPFLNMSALADYAQTLIEEES